MSRDKNVYFSMDAPPLKCLYKANVRIQELPQPGDSRPVLPPPQRTLSRQIMRNWEPWTTNIEKSNNHRMIQLLAFRAQRSIPATSVQDLDHRPCSDNSHSSVLCHEMETFDPGKNAICTLTWTSLDFLSHIKRRTIDNRFPSNVFHYDIICRHAKLNQRLHRFTTGWFINWV